jgi:uncharacterized protein (TIGR00269 family)
MADPKRCDDCPSASVAWLRYSGQHLCAKHLHESVEKRVRREVKRQGGLADGRIVVAFSGGKDSAVALQLVHEMVADRRKVELVALTVDEGIHGYRPHGLEVAARVTKRLGIEHVVRRTKDLAGADMDAIQAARPGLGACSYCGVFRRRIMNDVANDLGATRLVTGHNLDDTAQAILMNLASAEFEKLARLGPHDTKKPGLTQRLLPLRVIPESEVYLYALTKKLDWHEDECPYSHDAGRTVYRNVLYQMEDNRPGTRHALLRTFDTMKPWLEAHDDRIPLGSCARCGEPASGLLCKVCEFRDSVASLTAPNGPGPDPQRQSLVQTAPSNGNGGRGLKNDTP